MIGVDTNILIRVFLEDDIEQVIISQNLLKKLAETKKLFISSYAILEMVWVMKMKNISRDIICESLLDILDSPGITTGQKEVVISAFEKYKKGKADFGDYMILSEGENYGAAKIVSFDKIFCKDNSNCLLPGKVQL